MPMRIWMACGVLSWMMVNTAISEIPRPEHPRPDFKRELWMNLNGVWEFAETDDADASFLDRDMPDKINVPFCRESELSGLGRKGFVDYVWYRRAFSIPEAWKGKEILLHIGACDWETTVWVNGSEVGFHRGGNGQFSFDISKHLKEGENTIVIRAFDNVRSGLQTAGKQSQREESHGIFYTRTTGIWQTVWLEAVPQTSIKTFSITPDIEQGIFLIEAHLAGDDWGMTLSVEAFLDSQLVGEGQSDAQWRNTLVHVPLKEKKLWTLDAPTLYSLKITLKKGEETIDEVETYAGLREVDIQGRAILLNGKPIFQRLVLDQGFYPDGVWTAPSDEALARDIELSKSVGFNGARLHQKVFEPRFLYHADRLGYLLWGEYPSFGVNYGDPATDEPILREWQEILNRDRNHPSIIGWCPFNETPPEAGRVQRMAVDLTRELDPSRPVLETSGWTHTHPHPELIDAHDYNQDPVSFKEKWDRFFDFRPSLPVRYGAQPGGNLRIPFFVSEFGGIGWDIGGGWGYGNTPKTMEEFYARFQGLVEAQLFNRNFFAYCYTQLTDVEQERNGIFTFDRKSKFEAEKLHAIQSQAASFEKDPVLVFDPSEQLEWSVVVKPAHDKDSDTDWSYTTENPGEGWTRPDFKETGWRKGPAGFGDREEGLLSTRWSAPDIWLRKPFIVDDSDFKQAAALIFFDNKTEVFVNGELVWEKEGWNNAYEVFDVTEALKGKLKNGTNTIAVHTHQDEGGRYIDVGLFLGR